MRNSRTGVSKAVERRRIRLSLRNYTRVIPRIVGCARRGEAGESRKGGRIALWTSRRRDSPAPEGDVGRSYPQFAHADHGVIPTTTSAALFTLRPRNDAVVIHLRGGIPLQSTGVTGRHRARCRRLPTGLSTPLSRLCTALSTETRSGVSGCSAEDGTASPRPRGPTRRRPRRGRRGTRHPLPREGLDRPRPATARGRGGSPA